MILIRNILLPQPPEREWMCTSTLAWYQFSENISHMFDKINLKRSFLKRWVMAHTFNLSTPEAEAGGALWVQGQPGSQSKSRSARTVTQRNPISQKQSKAKKQANGGGGLLRKTVFCTVSLTVEIRSDEVFKQEILWQGYLLLSSEAWGLFYSEPYQFALSTMTHLSLRASCN